MKIPFTLDEFLGVFRTYNETIWPGQILLYVIAIFLTVSLYKQWNLSNRIILFGLAFFWLWMGVVYHIIFFSPINPAAKFFGLLFILQALTFFYLAVKKKLSFQFIIDWRGIVGVTFILYSLIFYPLIGKYFGHVLPSAPSFGVPCPTTIFTFGILMFSKEKIRWYLLLIPVLWSLIGFSAALNLKMYEDFGLVVAGITGLVVCSFVRSNNK